MLKLRSDYTYQQCPVHASHIYDAEQEVLVHYINLFIHSCSYYKKKYMWIPFCTTSWHLDNHVWWVWQKTVIQARTLSFQAVYNIQNIHLIHKNNMYKYFCSWGRNQIHIASGSLVKIIVAIIFDPLHVHVLMNKITSSVSHAFVIRGVTPQRGTLLHVRSYNRNW